MDRQVQASHLYDIAMPTRDLDLSPAQLGALGRLPNVDVTASLQHAAKPWA